MFLNEEKIKLDFFKKYYSTGEPKTREEVERLKTIRLHSLVRHAIRHSPFYRELYASAGINESNVDDITVEDLPIVDKEIIMDNYDQVVCHSALKKDILLDFVADPRFANKRYRGRYEIIHTSGTSGRPGLFAYDAKDLNLLNILFVRYMYCPTFLFAMLRHRMAFLGAAGGHYAAYSSMCRARDYRIRFLAIPVEASFKEVLRSLQSFQPTILVAYSSMLEKVAEAQLKGVLNIRPETVITGGEKLTSKQAALSKEAFGVKARSIYGASESIMIGAETAFEEAMVVFEHWNIVEALDGNDRKVPDGKDGRAVLTNLYNYAQPTVRYRLDDIIRLDEPPEGGALPFRVIKDVEGRAEDFLKVGRDKNEFIHPLVFVEFYVPGLKQLQIVQRSATFLTVRVVPESSLPAEPVCLAVRKRMQQILDNYGVGKEVAFEIEIADVIEPDPVSGKYRLIVSQREP